MEHREQIAAVVREAARGWGEGSPRGRAAFVKLWQEVRRQLRALRDTATTLREDEQTALLLLHSLPMPAGPAAGELPAD